MKIKSTTILAVKKDKKVVFIGDGQATAGERCVMKGNVRKVRRIFNGKVIVGFAGGTADAFTLMELFETKLKSENGDLTRASIETAKNWRSDKALRHLEALMLVSDGKKIFLISGTGDVMEPEYDAIAIGSGGDYAVSAARALLNISKDRKLNLDALEIAKRSMEIASSICIFTNSNYTIEEINE